MNEVVSLSYPEPGVAMVQMHDRQYRNTFSQALIGDLIRAFEQIKQNPDAKVVVVSGYDSYFCCGGTKEELINIFEGRTQFTDLDFYRLLLDCELPTISAMQGHALGGGLAFGCYADIIVMAKECLYSTNFMKYGFTPGMGATHVVPKKLGHVLGCEMLLTANNYHGGELQQRGVSAKVVKKAEVLTTAMDLAKELAEKPVVSLKLLKQQFRTMLEDGLDAAIAQELSMHEVSFAQPEVRQRIEVLFGG